MKEYILLSCIQKEDDLSCDWMYRYLLQKNYKDTYDDLFYSQWCNPFDKIDDYFVMSFDGRNDYKCIEHLHTLYNQLTKEMVIIITNRYQIIVKCDKIPIGIVKTVQQYYQNIRLFCHDIDFEEVNYELD